MLLSSAGERHGQDDGNHEERPGGGQGLGQAREEGRRAQGRNIAERMVFAACLLIVLALLVYSGYQAFAGEDLSPFVTVRVERTYVRDGHAFAVVSVHNPTTTALRDVTIAVRVPPEPTETQITFDYLPEHARRDGFLALPQPLSPEDVDVRVESFQSQ